MAVKASTVWAVDIGNSSLKALHLSTERGVVEVIDFESIRHGKILSGSGVKEAEKEELAALSLRKFVSKHDLSRDEIVVSVPSQNSFARFVNLPPVDQKRIPEIVKFEAVQQIPFDINDVQWDWQLMSEDDSSEIKVGIFAIKNDVVNSELEHYEREDIQVSYVQMAPMALYNYILYDRPDLFKSDSRAVVVINIGAENTDLVVCTKSTVWQRCILLGGNTFTKAIAEAFKLTFEKAEKLKRTAPVSKYARQIFQAMKPVFADLASEVQRSLGFYNSSNPNTKITKVIALGGGTKLRGLLKYLQQTLQIPVERPDTFKRLSIGPGVSPAKFHEGVCDYGIVYGLALQGLQLGKIESNLLPRTIARSMAWAGKGRYFTAAASILLLVSILCFGRTGLDWASYKNHNRDRQETNNIISEVRDAKQKYEAEKTKGDEYQAMIDKEFKPFDYRDVITELHQTILKALPNAQNNSSQRDLYDAFAKGDIEGVINTSRKGRRQIFVTSMSIQFASDLSTARFGARNLRSRSPGSMLGIGEEEYDEYGDDGRGEWGRPGYEELYPPAYSRALVGGVEEGAEGAEVEEEGPGFVVTIAGYSPYGASSAEMGEFMDPPGVGDDQRSWGFITRLARLDDLVKDANSPFKLYKKAEVEHFNLEAGDVGFGVPMPGGIGIREYVAKPNASMTGYRSSATGDWILIDPMTKETISKVAVSDSTGKQKLDRSGKPVFEINDHWFTLNVKFLWREAPEEILNANEAAATSMNQPYLGR